MKKANAYDIISDHVKKYWDENFPIDVIVFFKMKYDYEHCYTYYEELVECEAFDDYEHMTFLYDFCEGQTDCIVEKIIPLYEVVKYYRKKELC